MNIFALHAEKCPNRVFSGVLGEFCAGDAADGGVLGEFCAGDAADGGVLGELCIGAAEEAGELCRGGPHGERVYVRPQSSLLLVITRGQISHAIPLKVFQVMKPNR